MKKKKFAITTFMIITILFSSIFTFNTSVHAMYSATVLTYWKEIHNMNGVDITNKDYETINFLHGYTYKETVKDVTTWYDYLLGIYSVQLHYRNYSTYSFLKNF